MNGRGASFIGLSFVIVLLLPGILAEVGDNDEKGVDSTNPGFLPVETIQADDEFMELVSVSSYHHVIATAGSDNMIRFWSYPKLDLVDNVAFDNDIAVMEWSPDNRWIAFINYSWKEDRAWVNIYDTGRRIMYERFDMLIWPEYPWHFSLEWSPNDLHLLFSMNGDTVYVIDSEVTSDPYDNMWKYQRMDARITDLEWFGDSDSFAVSYDDGNVDIVEYPNMVMLRTFDVNGTIGNIEISRDEKKILSYQQYDLGFMDIPVDLSIKILNITNGTNFHIDRFFFSLTDFTFELSPDGSRFFVGMTISNGSSGISIWDTESGEFIDFFGRVSWGYFNENVSMDWIEDGVIVTVDGNGELIIWNEDIDKDGVLNNEDAFPENPEEAFDSDGDGVGDNSDAFPNNEWASLDSDWDGYPDELHNLAVAREPDLMVDEYPDDPERWKEDTECCGSFLIPILIVIVFMIAVFITALFILLRRRRS